MLPIANRALPSLAVRLLTAPPRRRLLMTKPCAIRRCERPLRSRVTIENLQSNIFQCSNSFQTQMFHCPIFIARITYLNELKKHKILIAVCSNLERASRSRIINRRRAGFFFTSPRMQPINGYARWLGVGASLKLSKSNLPMVIQKVFC